MTHPAAIATLALLIAPSLSGAAEPPKPATGATRTEKDLLGEKQVPADAYYGVQTARGLENFQISGILMNHYPGFVEAFAMVKVAAARANTAVGAMKPDRLAAIEKAYEAVMQGKYRDQFLVDWYQGGAGTSTNMNANEVLANRGLELRWACPTSPQGGARRITSCTSTPGTARPGSSWCRRPAGTPTTSSRGPGSPPAIRS